MNEQPISSIEIKLTALYDTKPSEDFIRELGNKLQTHSIVKTSAWRGWMRDLRRQCPRVRLAWTAAALLVLAAVVMAFTLQGRSLAQVVTRSLLGYFNVTDRKSLPKLVTPAPAPTYSFQPVLVPFEPQMTPAVEPAKCGAAWTLLTASPLCRMFNLQAEAGFELKVLGISDLPLMTSGGRLDQNAVNIRYFTEDGKKSYVLSQGVGNLREVGWGLVPADAVRQVVVGNHPGELVIGDFVNYIDKPTFDWSTHLGGVHLRWQEDDRWYSIDANRYYWNSDSASQRAERDQLISEALSLGQNLMPLSAGSGNMAGQVDQIPAERVGFQIRTPAALPAGFSLEGLYFGTRNEGQEGTVVITYSYMENGKWVAGITLSEAVHPAVDFAASFIGRYSLHYDLTQDEEVQVGPVSGRYMVRAHDKDMGDSGSTALVWEKDGVKFMLQPTYDESSFGGRFTQAELIAIAESIR